MLKTVKKEWPFFLCLATAACVFSVPVPIADWSYEGLVAATLFLITLSAIFRVTHHADELAEMLGEPYGTLILTMSATIIEVAIMITVLGHNENNPTFVRDTIAATVMITVGLMLGLAMFIGAFVHRQQTVNTEGALTYLGLIVPLAVLTLILPNFTSSTIGPTLALAQEVFIAILSIMLYAIFLFIQTRRHRQMFKDHSAPEPLTFDPGSPERKQKRAYTHKALWTSIVWLVGNLFLVVFLAEELAVLIDDQLEEKHLPEALGGLFVALLILAPECLASVNAALHNRLQRSVNIALGSGLATLSLSVPTILLAATLMGHQLILGLPNNEIVMMLATLWVANIALATDRTNLMQGAVLLVLFLTFGFLIIVP